MADEFLKGLLDVFSVASPAILSVLSSHWTELTHYLYVIGLNDARLVLRDALKAIHTIVRGLSLEIYAIQLLTPLRNTKTPAIQQLDQHMCA